MHFIFYNFDSPIIIKVKDAESIDFDLLDRVIKRQNIDVRRVPGIFHRLINIEIPKNLKAEISRYTPKGNFNFNSLQTLWSIKGRRIHRE